MLRAALEVGLDAGRLEVWPQLGDRPIDVALATGATGVEQLGELAEAFGLEGLEGEVLELPLHLPDPEPLGQRRVDLHGLAGDALLLRGQAVERAHVVEPIGELDQDDPDVLGHRQQHLADVLGLLLLVAVGAELGQLGDAVDELGDLGAEPLLDVGQAVLGVLGDVVEERRLDRHGIEPELGQDLGRGDGMGDVRLAGGAALSLVGGDGEVERTPDPLEIRSRVRGQDRRVEGRSKRLEVRAVDRRLWCGGRAARAALGRTVVRRRLRAGLCGRHDGFRIAAASQAKPARRNASSASARSSHACGPSAPMIERSWPLPASSTTSPGRARSNAASMAARRSAISSRS